VPLTLVPPVPLLDPDVVTEEDDEDEDEGSGGAAIKISVCAPSVNPYRSL
jgi:hypothetical protein